MVNRERLANKIIKLRIKKGYSQRRLAIAAGVSNSTISRIENASSDADPETLKKLTYCLDISYEELMDASGYISTNNLAGVKRVEKEINVKVNIDNLDESIVKAKRYVELLKEAKTLAEELASVKFDVNIGK
ncbi:helix-turn-helix domain-containing protein [Senegalia massiliensis]|uniref:XRE family transcriptional regulator n=1 Tax=Senegalia massiliensis TaxID=1720316 RepID=A0A845R1A4_9CLOT|nr:XRE family transcriptional regulator [Senegalia massiliensis]